MAKHRADTQTLDLLDWTPADPVQRFPAEAVRAVSLAAKVSHAVSLALKECERTREEVAADMSAYLGEEVSKAMLDAYASESRDTHNISVARLIALIHATGDVRLLSLIAEPFEHAVIDCRYLPAVEEAMLTARIEELRRAQQVARHRWQRGM